MKMKALFVGLLLSCGLASAAVEDFGSTQRYTGAGVNNGDVVFLTQQLVKFDACMILAHTGGVKVDATLDDTHYTDSAVTVQDYGATTNDPVDTMAAGRMYVITGAYWRLRVTQVGAVAANVTMICWKR